MLSASIICAGCSATPEAPEAPATRFDYAAICGDPDAAPDGVLQTAARTVVNASPDKQNCERRFTLGERLFVSVLTERQRTLAGAADYRTASQPEIATMQREITRLWRADQSARGAYNALATDDKNGVAFWARRLAAAHTARIDTEASAFMESLLDQIDWVDIDRFGSAVSTQAWLLVQHADNHPTLQQLALERMQPYLQSAGIKPANYAYLWDRVAVNAGQLQRYGTQPTWDCSDGQLELQPLENPDSVDQRRAELGMPPAQEDLARMASAVCAPTGNKQR